MSDVVRALLPLFENRIHELGVTVNLELHETALLTIDQSQLDFIVTSLVTNSLDALVGQPRRVVTLRTGSREQYAVLEVMDSGCGHPRREHGRDSSPLLHHQGRMGPGRFPAEPGTGGRAEPCGVPQHRVRARGQDRGGKRALRGSLFRVLLPGGDDERGLRLPGR